MAIFLLLPLSNVIYDVMLSRFVAASPSGCNNLLKIWFTPFLFYLKKIKRFDLSVSSKPVAVNESLRDANWIDIIYLKKKLFHKEKCSLLFLSVIVE